ncbi:hypothetical protein [Silvanigrella sp.]|jgi:aspartate/glutamate racemase|uniref:hypothetical protein n=1 Tax=Silvanigrella sp. TaxID=2024976 RepID=UPI0037CACC83
MQSQLVIGVLTLSGPQILISFLEKITYFSRSFNSHNKEFYFPNFVFFTLSNNINFNKKINEIETKNSIKILLENYNHANFDCFLVIGSNSCYYIDYISSLIKAPIINMATEVAKLISNDYKKPALLINDAIMNHSFYQNELSPIGVSYFYDETLQILVNELVISTKQTGLSNHSKKIWKNIYTHCEENNCDSIVSDFSELSLLLDNKIGKNIIPIIDANDILAFSCIKNCLNLDLNYYKKAL